MAEQIPASIIGTPLDKWELTIKNQSFRMKELYIALWNYLQEEDWQDMYTGKDKFETRYQQVNDTGGGRTYHIWWRAWRKPKNDAGGYYKFYLRINMITRNMGTKEVMHRDEKHTLDNGEFLVRCSVYLEENASGLKGFDDSNFLVKLFKKPFMTQVRGEVKDQVEGELWNWSKDLFQWFQIQTGVQKEDDKHDFHYAQQGLH